MIAVLSLAAILKPHYNQNLKITRKQMTILIVDSDQSFRESVTNLLLVSGFDKFEVAEGHSETLTKISNTFYDLVLIDLFIPNMSGLELAQEINKLTPKTKIYLMIQDRQQPGLDRTIFKKLNFPTILKSFVSHTLPQLLAEEFSEASGKY
jgi:CheY-like chemotaxis protein